MTIVQSGRYRHYKGKEYTVIGVARHSETEEELVVYRKEYDDHGLWVRPWTCSWKQWMSEDRWFLASNAFSLSRVDCATLFRPDSGSQ